MTTMKRPRSLAGSGMVTSRATGLLGPALAAMCALPRNGATTATLSIETSEGRPEIWRRGFGSRRRTTHVSWMPNGFSERFGPVRLTFVAQSSGTFVSTRVGFGPLTVTSWVKAFVSIDESETTVRIEIRQKLGALSYCVELDAGAPAVLNETNGVRQ